MSTRNISIASVAVSFFVLSSCMCCIAFNPRGVAALSSPSIFADTFINIAPIAGCPFGMPGNKRENSGLTSRPKKGIIPPRSPIFIMPIQRDSTPVNPNDSSNAVLAESNDEFIIFVQMSMFPLKIVSPKANRNASRKKPIQM